jgi:anti-sigma B factor antagonist
MSGFAIDLNGDAAACVVAVSGDIDIEHADDLAAVGRLATESLDNGRHLVIDLTDVQFMDSTGLGALIEIRDAAARRGQRVELRAVHPRVRKVIAITGLLGEFDITPSDNERIA